jgi:hypothetical protein
MFRHVKLSAEEVNELGTDPFRTAQDRRKDTDASAGEEGAGTARSPGH